MAIKPYYTSDTLIEAVKRKMSFPIAQVTYSENNILAFANEELFNSQVPSILQYHEEYLVYTQDVTLVANKSRYPIPSRAIGMKLRDVFYRDNSGQLIEMSRISPDDRSFFENASSVAPAPIHYYIQNNHVIIIPSVGDTPTGTLVFSYYLRPNSLVTDDQAAICESFSRTVTVENASLLAGELLTLDGTSLIADNEFTIGINSATTANSLVSAINSGTSFTASASSNLVTIFYYDRSLEFSSDTPGLLVQETVTINTTEVPEGIVDGGLIDLLQTEGGHNTLAFDVLLAEGAVSPTSITLTEDQLPEDFVVGDYICAQYECIIPQIPTDLHGLLAERTCARIMEAQGDREGLQTANQKIAELEGRQTTMLDSRVEGSPQKILNKNGLLRNASGRFGRRR